MSMLETSSSPDRSFGNNVSLYIVNFLISILLDIIKS